MPFSIYPDWREFVFHFHSDLIVVVYLHVDLCVRCLGFYDDESSKTNESWFFNSDILRFQTCGARRLRWCHSGLNETLGCTIRPHLRTTTMNLSKWPKRNDNTSRMHVSEVSMSLSNEIQPTNKSIFGKKRRRTNNVHDTFLFFWEG